MPFVGVVGKDGHEVEKELNRMSGGKAECLNINNDENELDILVVSEGSPVLTKAIPKLSKSGYLVVNADDKTIFPYIVPANAKVVTYGFNNKACITASSISDDSLQICIQRGFTALDGAIKDPQEFSAISGVASPEATLGAAAAWVICQ